jgi:hypothetical protein
MLGCSTGPTDTWTTPDYDNTASVMAEIDAAAGLTFDDARVRALSAIASREHLSARSQVYLVKKSMKSLSFDDAKRDVLLSLINNPYFVHEGKMTILGNLDGLMFDSGKQQVLAAIDARGVVPTQRQLRQQRQPRHQKHDKKPLSTEVHGVQVEAYGDVRLTVESKLD